MRPFSLIVSHIPPWCDRDGLVDLSQPFMCHILITCLHLTSFEVVEKRVPASAFMLDDQ